VLNDDVEQQKPQGYEDMRAVVMVDNWVFYLYSTVLKFVIATRFENITTAVEEIKPL
jgi:hypothetical protein